MRALCLLRPQLHYRRESFIGGLKIAGFMVVDALNDPSSGDVLLIWNRYAGNHELAYRFESAGARVIVTENGQLGKSWRGGNWYSMSLGHHAGAGTWVDGGPSRWDALVVELAPWRAGKEVVILDQRGIGEPGVASPPGWAERVRRQTGGRIRPHPGKAKESDLEHDLRNAYCVVCWHSGAALRALAMGTPAFYDFPQWWGAQAAKPLASLLVGEPPLMDDAARLAMFRRLIWAQWSLDEIADGTAFRHLLESS